jgi:hypothetical protein
VGSRGRPTFSRVRGGLHIGRTFFARRGLLADVKEGDSRPHGVVDTMSALAHPGIDPDAVHPDVQVFFTNTESLSLFIRSAWRFPFSLWWLVARPFLRLIGQFVLPAQEATIETEVQALDAKKDGRDDARAIIRTYKDSGITMQAVAYATWTRGDKHFMSAAFPLPFCQLTGILRLDPAAQGEGADAGVTLTSERKDGDDAGVYLVFGNMAVRTPFGERFSLTTTGFVHAETTRTSTSTSTSTSTATSTSTSTVTSTSTAGQNCPGRE